MPFPPQPTLNGNLVHLRPLRAEDYDALYAVASDPLIWEQHPANDRWKPDVFREFFDGAMASGGAFLVTDATTGAVIGSTRYANYDEAASEIEIGWTFLARSHWGGRYNGEMKALLLRHAFEHVRSVVLLIGPNNLRSQMAARKIGAALDGMRVNPAGVESQVWRISAIGKDCQFVLPVR